MMMELYCSDYQADFVYLAVGPVVDLFWTECFPHVVDQEISSLWE